MTELLRWLGGDGVTAVERVTAWSWHAAAPPARPLLYAVLGLGVVLAAVNFLPHLAMRRRVRVGTFFLRLGMVGLLVLALCRLELVVDLRARQPQRWLVLLDDSASMATADEHGQPRYAAALADLDRLRAGLGAGHTLTVRTLNRGADLPPAAGSGPTWLGRAIARDVLGGGPLDRLVLLTDGRDIEGRDCALLGRDLQARDVAVAIRVYGSDVRPSDAALFATAEATTLRLGDPLVVQGAIRSTAAPTEYQVRLTENGKDVLTTTVPPEQRDWFRVVYRPPKAGKHRYTLELLGQDLLPGNNAVSFLVQVVEEQIKVLLIEGAPRFEFKLLRYALDVDPMLHLVSLCHLPGGGVYVQGEALHQNPQAGLIGARADLFKYDVVILRDVPRSLFRADGDASESRLQLLVAFVEQRGGGLIVCGGQEAYRAGGYEDSALAAVLPFDLSDHFGQEAQFPGRFFATVPNGLYDHPLLRLLPDPAANRERWRVLRELDGCNNVGRLRPLATPLLTRWRERRTATGTVEKQEVPVLAYQAVGEGKVVAFSVDTLWRWQLQPDFLDAPLQMLLANTVRYVAPPPGARAGEPRVALKDNAPQVGQEAVLFTTLRDENYEPIRRAELKVVVTRPDQSTESLYPRDLPEQPGYYEYRVRLDLPGEYTVVAEYGKQRQQTTFVAGAAGHEFADLSADRAGMAALATAAGGTLFTNVDDYLAQTRRAPTTVAARRALPVWNSPLALLLFLLLVAADCYLRKRQGLA